MVQAKQSQSLTICSIKNTYLLSPSPQLFFDLLISAHRSTLNRIPSILPNLQDRYLKQINSNLQTTHQKHRYLKSKGLLFHILHLFGTFAWFHMPHFSLFWISVASIAFECNDLMSEHSSLMFLEFLGDTSFDKDQDVVFCWNLWFGFITHFRRFLAKEGRYFSGVLFSLFIS